MAGDFNVIPFPRVPPASTGRYQAILDLWNGTSAGAAALAAAAALEYEQQLKRARAAEAMQDPPEAC
jgi:hypothetical protein